MSFQALLILLIAPAVGWAEIAVTAKAVTSTPTSAACPVDSLGRLAATEHQRARVADLMAWTKHLHEGLFAPNALLRSRAYDWALGELYLNHGALGVGTSQIAEDPKVAAEQVLSLMETMFDDSFYRASKSMGG